MNTNEFDIVCDLAFPFRRRVDVDDGGGGDAIVVCESRANLKFIHTKQWSTLIK